MKVTSIVAIVLRLFALQWFVSGVLALLPALALLPGLSDGPVLPMIAPLLTPGFLMVAGWVAWSFAPGIARKAVVPADPELQFHSVAPAHFYTLGLAIVGLANCFDSVPHLFSWLYWLAANRPGEAFTTGPDFFPFLESVIHAGFGAVLTIFSPALGRKLAKVAPAGAATP